MPIRVCAVAILTLAWCRMGTAQQFSVVCTVKAEPLTVRAEGVTELMADLVLNCTGGIPTEAGKPLPLARVQIVLTNSTITSRLLSTASGLSEATLLIDDPPPRRQRLCQPPGGICEVTAPSDGTPNVFFGVMATPNSVVWPGVPFDPPGTGTRLLRITNVRANANKLTAFSPRIVMSVQVSCSTPVLLDSAQQTVAMAQTGLLAGVADPARIPQCGHNPALLCGGSGSSDFDVRVREGFPEAFRPRNVEPAQNLPGTLYHTESGFYDRTLFTANPNAGLADFGTRIRLRFESIADGTSLFLPVEIGLTDMAGAVTGQIRLVDTNPCGESPPGFKPVQATVTVNGLRAAKIGTMDGIACAVYEVLSSNPVPIETATIPVAVVVESPSANLPAPVQVTVRVSFAPVNDAATDSVPRFQDSSTPLLAFESVACPSPGPLTCTASTVPVTVRSEGITELVGDLALTCTGGIPAVSGAPVPLSTVQISLNTNITSRLLDRDTMKSEATLLMNDLNACSAVSPISNPILGTQTNSNSIVFQDVPISPPTFGDTRVIRIANVRANACQLAVSPMTPIVMSIAVNGLQQVSLNNSQLTVGLSQQGLVADAPSGTGIQCVSHNTSPLIDNSMPGSNGCNFSVTVHEGFVSSFKRRNIALTPDDLTSPQPLAQNVPGYPYYTETGFYAPDLTGGAGLADFGTRILLTFNDIGKDVHVFTPVEVELTVRGEPSSPPQPPSPVPPGITTGRMKLVSTDQYGNSVPGFASVDASSSIMGSDFGEVNYNGTTGYAVYEVVNSDPNALESASIPVAVAYTSNPGQNPPSPGLTTVNVGLAPVGGQLAGIQTSDSNAPIPRFCNVSTAMNVFTINLGTCNLLFPFVSNQLGFDTSIVISNTTTDPYGTTPQNGLVTLYFYGTVPGNSPCVPRMVTTSPVFSGTELIFTLSNGGNYGIQANAGCQGYMIAVANFQYCHGFAFISDVGGMRLAEGYLPIQLDIYNSTGVNRTGIVGEVQGH